MQESRDDLTRRENAHAPGEPNVQLELSPADAELLMRLQDAGVIDLDALKDLDTDDPRLVEWTYEAFRKDMGGRQGLAESTCNERVRYIRYLAGYDDAPVEVRPPDERTWVEHVHVRRNEGAPGTTLNNYRKALKSLLKFLSYETGRKLRWESLESQFDEADPDWRLPPNHLVPEFWLRQFGGVSPLSRKTYQYLFFFGFHTGVRPPSELCELNVEDVDFERGVLHVRQPKKGGELLIRNDLPDYLLTAHTTKSLKNWIEHWRPKLDPKTQALFPNRNGERFDPNYLRYKLQRIGQRIWPAFTPYTMRRWYATELLVATDFNVYVVAQQLGDRVSTVEDHYLDKARARTAMEGQYSLPLAKRQGDP